MRVLVTGSREFTDVRRVWETLDNLYAKWANARAAICDEPLHHPYFDVFVVVHGGAIGADHIADNWAYSRCKSGAQVAIEPHAADWRTHGRRAGPIRNQEMVDSGIDLVVAFLQATAENRGTTDCIRRAYAEGIEVECYWNAPRMITLPVKEGTL